MYSWRGVRGLITTERLTIRHVKEEDWRRIRDIWVDFKKSPYAQYDIPHNTEDEDVRARISRWAQFCSGVEHIFFTVCLNENVIGYVAFNKREDNYEVGYCFHSNYHGVGYAKESHIALFEHMKNLGITRFTAGTAMNNTPSVALLQSLGFHLVGMEKVSFYKDEEGNDIVFEGGIFALEL